MKTKFLNALVIALVLFQAVAPIGALAAVGTDQYIYYAGDIVYISGNEMQAGEAVNVDVLYPDGSLAQHHEVLADDGGNFSDTYVVPNDGPAGEYTVVSTGQSSGATFSTTFDPPKPDCGLVANITSPANGDIFTAASVGGTASVTFSWSTSIVFASAYNVEAKVDGNPISTAANGSQSLNLGAGSHTFQVKADALTTDCQNPNRVANATITVNNPVVSNTAPTAVNDTYSTNEDNALTVAAPGVLGNDADVDGDTLTTALGSVPSHGMLTLNADGSFTYTPNANFNGSDSFTYKANDGTADSNTATVTLNVTAVNDAPSAADDSYTTVEDTPLTVAALGVLGNDTDVEGSSLTAALVTGPADGLLTLNADGSFDYSPDANFNGSDSFAYQAYDGSANSNTVTVTLNVTAVNDAPVAADDNYVTDEDTPLTVAASGVLGNDSDVDADSLNVALVSGPTNGALTLNANGSFTYIPTGNFNGSDSFTYKANDGSLNSNNATVNLTVNAVNDAPMLDPIGDKTVDEETALSFTATASDVDVPADTLTFSLVGAPVGAGISSGGTFSWTPTEAQGPGDYTFTVKVCDNGTPSGCDSESITVHVNEVNVAPVLNTIGNTSVDEETLLSFTATASDQDIPVQTLSFSLVSAPAGANIDSSTGAFSWTPSEAQGPSTYIFDVCVSDGDSSDCETIEVTVAEVNLAPVLGSVGNKTVDEETLLSFTATATDADIPANTLTFSLVSAPAGASIDSSTGAFSWTPSEAQGPSTYTFDVCVSDGDLIDCETIIVTVNEVNVAPVLGSIGNQSVNEGSLLSFTATATDADLPANILNFSLVGAPAGASISSGGVFSWTPADNDGFSFKVKVCDNGSPVMCDEETITVTVNNVKPNVSALTVGGGTSTACLAGNAVTLNFGFTDPGVNDNPWVVAIDWGDGSAHTSYNANSQGVQPQQSHTYGAGSFTITVKVTDKDSGLGSSSSSAGVVSHLYNMTGILAPFNPDGTSVWKYGSTLPVKVKITDCNGIPVPGLAPKIGTSLVSSTDPNVSIDESASTSAADTTGIMRYDATAGQYIYNFASKNLPDPSATYYMTVKGTDVNGNIVTTPGMVQVKFGLKTK